MEAFKAAGLPVYTDQASMAPKPLQQQKPEENQNEEEQKDPKNKK